MADEPNTPPATGDPALPQEPAAPAAGTEPGDLGDAGKKALAEERRARRDAEARLKELEPLAARAKKLEDDKKSEAEKLTEKLTAAEKRAAVAESKTLRMEVATAKDLTQAQAKHLVGSTKEELEAHADELLKAFDAKPAGGDKKRTPVEGLRPGGLPSPPDATLAQQVTAAEKAGNWAEARRLKTRQLMELAKKTT
jgi:flagellar motor switch protein FliG